MPGCRVINISCLHSPLAPPLSSTTPVLRVPVSEGGSSATSDTISKPLAPPAQDLGEVGETPAPQIMRRSLPGLLLGMQGVTSRQDRMSICSPPTVCPGFCKEQFQGQRCEESGLCSLRIRKSHRKKGGGNTPKKLGLQVCTLPNVMGLLGSLVRRGPLKRHACTGASGNVCFSQQDTRGPSSGVPCASEKATSS